MKENKNEILRIKKWWNREKNILEDLYGNNTILKKRRENAIDKQILNEIIIQRVLYPLINEAFKLLGEGGVPSGRPGDVDIIFVKGKNCYITLYLFISVFLLSYPFFFSFSFYFLFPY